MKTRFATLRRETLAEEFVVRVERKVRCEPERVAKRRRF